MPLSRRSLFAAVAALVGCAALPAVSEAMPKASTIDLVSVTYYGEWEVSEPVTVFIGRTSAPVCRGGSCSVGGPVQKLNSSRPVRRGLRRVFGRR